MKNNIKKITSILVVVIVANLIANLIYKRFDLTQDKRYSLSNATKKNIKNIADIVTINVFLEGDFPAEFKRLQTETKLHLEELKSFNKNIHFKFINPKNKETQLIQKGFKPSNLTIEENGKLSEIIIFPWAEVTYKNKTEKINLLKDIFSNSQNKQLESSIQNLEYAFANAIHKVSTARKKKIAVLKGNGELEDIYLTSLLLQLKQYYKIAPFTLDSVATQPQKTALQLQQFDLILIAKPTKAFSEKQKYTLDQYIINGGKSIWAIDKVQAELDSMLNTGETLAYQRKLNLTDLLFNYGVRIKPNLIADLYSSKIPLAVGNIGNKTQFSTFFWEYHPVLHSKNNHAINKHIEAVNIKFASPLDTLKNNIKKTILLQSSSLSKTVGTPTILSFKNIGKKPNTKQYNKGNIPVAVLLEGNFTSAYQNRVKPFKFSNHKNSSTFNQMIIISDGDIVANSVAKGQPTELGVNKWTNFRYGNKEFLLNCVNYLLDDSGLINIRNKTVKINFLNKQKAYTEAKKWQFINLILPLLILLLFGIFFYFFKQKKYNKV